MPRGDALRGGDGVADHDASGAVRSVGDAQEKGMARLAPVERHDVLRGPAVVAQHERVVVDQHGALVLNPLARNGVSVTNVVFDGDRVPAPGSDEECGIRSLRRGVRQSASYDSRPRI